MAEFTPKKIVLGDINNGIEFTESDGVTPNAINDPIEAVAYAQTVVEHLTDTPDTSEINGTGEPNVSFVSDTTADGVTIHKFKFSNLSGATFTPSLDEAGNLSWSNNRNLPNPPTINISGRDYLFSSEVLSGTSIPQVNSEVTDMPLTSFNRAPVDDIDHCYLFYYYTPENIYYWLATQVVDIQKTTATLKILSVVRLTGYTPTIGKNGNWFIGGDDTGKPSYGASGVTDVVAGASYNQNDYTITPLTFNFEVGNSKTVNVKAAVGNVEDGSYAKLAQVVRVDAAQSLTDEQKQQAQKNIAITVTKAATSDTQVGWWRVAQISQNSVYDIKLTQSFNFNSPAQMNVVANVGYMDSTNAVLSLVSGFSVTAFTPSKIRVCGNTTACYIDIYTSDTAWNKTVVEIKGASGSSISPTEFSFIGTSDTVAGYNVVILDLVSGANTSGKLYQNGSPVLIGDQSAIFESDGVTVKEATKAAQDADGNVIPDTYATKTEATRTATYTQQGQVKMGSTTNGGKISSGYSDDVVPTIKNICDWTRNNFLPNGEPDWETGTVGSFALPSKGWYLIRIRLGSDYAPMTGDYYTPLFYFDGLDGFYPIPYGGYVNISSNGTIVQVVMNDKSYSQAKVSYYKLA